MKKNSDSFVSYLRRRVVSTALPLLAFLAVLPSVEAQRRYALDSTPNVTTRSVEIASIAQVASLPDGHVLVVASSKYVNGLEYPPTGIVRLDSTGHLDPTFVGPIGHIVVGADVTPSGAIWALGDFNGSYSDSVVKLTANGAIVPGITPIGAAQGDRVFALPDNGFYLVDGSSGVTNVRRFGSDGLPAPGFTTVVSNSYILFSTASATGRIALTAGSAGPTGVQVYDSNGTALPGATAGIPANFQATGATFDSQGALVLSGVTFPGTGAMLIRILPSGVRDTAFVGTTPAAGAFSDGVVALSDGSFVTYMRNGFGYPAQVLEFSATGILKNLLPVTYDQSGSPYIATVWSLSSGGYIVSGNFDRLAGVLSPRLARVSVPGTVDPAFHALFESAGQVSTLAQSADGVFVGGNFTRVNQSPAGNIAILKNQNTIDTSFPYLRWGTQSIVPLAGNGTLAFGNFEPLPGAVTFGLVKLRGDHTVDTNFLSGISLPATFDTALALPGGASLIGGSFGGFSGTPASYLVRATATGSIDPTFNGNFALSGGFNPGITALAALPTGGYLVGGSFTEFQGASRPALARITANGALDPAFNPPVGMSPYLPPKNITVLSDGRFYALGALGDAASWWLINLYRFNADGTVDDTFTSPFDYVQAYAVSSSGDVFVSGTNNSGAPNSSSNLVRVSAAGVIDPTFAFTPDSPPLALLIDSKDRLVLGGTFTMINGKPRQALARLVPLPLSVTIAGPTRLTVPLHSAVALSANVESAAGAVSYQWYHDCEKIKNATSSTFTIAHVVKKDEGKYTVIVKAAGETAESRGVTLDVKPAH